MNRVIFRKRLIECRKRKFSSQQKFADAYLGKYGTIRQPKSKTDNNMFGTVQSWEQGKSTPAADVLCNICDLLDCDADYLLGRINQRTHDIDDAHRYTGLSAEALEQLHEYRENLREYPDPKVLYDMAENWSSHPYFQAYALYLIDELLVGSKSHKLSAGSLDRLFEKMMEDEIAVNPNDYTSEPDDPDPSTQEERGQWAAECKDFVDVTCYRITNNIRDIIYENAVDQKLPNALKIQHPSDGTYFFGIEDEDQ